MGCNESKSNQNDVLLLSETRKKYMEQAIVSYEAFAVAQYSYSSSLKKVGVALSEYSRKMFSQIQFSVQNSSPASLILDQLTKHHVSIPSSPHFTCSPILENPNEDLLQSESSPLLSTSDGSHVAETLKSSQDIVKATANDIMNEIDCHFLEASKCSVLHFSSAAKTNLDRTHAALLELEGKFYNDLKALELVKAKLIKRKATGAKPEEKTDEEKLTAAYEAMDLALKEIIALRDDVLFRKIVELINAMAKMWQCVHQIHEKQLKTVSTRFTVLIHALSGSCSIVASDEQCEASTVLLHTVKDWKTQLQNVVIHQRKYVENLYKWDDLVKRQDRDSLVSPLKCFVDTWKDVLGRFSYELGISAIDGFLVKVRDIVEVQEVRMKARRKHNVKSKSEKENECCEVVSEYLMKKMMLSVSDDLEELFRLMVEFSGGWSQMYRTLGLFGCVPERESER